MSLQKPLSNPVQPSSVPARNAGYVKDTAGNEMGDGNGSYNAFNAVERDLIIQSLTRYGSIRKVGQALGVSHTTVIKKMRKYGIERK